MALVDVDTLAGLVLFDSRVLSMRMYQIIATKHLAVQLRALFATFVAKSIAVGKHRFVSAIVRSSC